MRPATTLKRCGCGAVYTLEEWRALVRVGIVDVERELEEEEPVSTEETVPPFELRDCARCGSTIGVVVPYRGGSAYPPIDR